VPPLTVAFLLRLARPTYKTVIRMLADYLGRRCSRYMRVDHQGHRELECKNGFCVVGNRACRTRKEPFSLNLDKATAAKTKIIPPGLVSWGQSKNVQ
jgi:hypothetical protein